jgi:hypothetical protein
MLFSAPYYASSHNLPTRGEPRSHQSGHIHWPAPEVQPACILPGNSGAAPSQSCQTSPRRLATLSDRRGLRVRQAWDHNRRETVFYHPLRRWEVTSGKPLNTKEPVSSVAVCQFGLLIGVNHEMRPPQLDGVVNSTVPHYSCLLAARTEPASGQQTGCKLVHDLLLPGPGSTPQFVLIAPLHPYPVQRTY